MRALILCTIAALVNVTAAPAPAGRPDAGTVRLVDRQACDPRLTFEQILES